MALKVKVKLKADGADAKKILPKLPQMKLAGLDGVKKK